MSNKYIEVGPGKDIDPGEVEASIKWGEETLRHSAQLERTLWTAIQQREERVTITNEEIKKYYQDVKKHEGNPYADGKRHAVTYIYAILNNISQSQAIDILEGTDGE